MYVLSAMVYSLRLLILNSGLSLYMYNSDVVNKLLLFIVPRYTYWAWLDNSDTCIFRVSMMSKLQTRHCHVFDALTARYF